MPKERIDDQLWSLIDPLLPEQVPHNRQYTGRKPLPDRAVLTDIVFELRSGIAWNLMPQEMECGSDTACWRRLVAWQKAGVWQRIHETLLAERGRPLHKPHIVQGDRGYSSEPHRQRLRERGITPVLAKIGSPHGSGLGKTRWQVER